MGEPEVTRERARRALLTDDPGDLTMAELARTVVALYDQLDALLAGQIGVVLDTTPLIPPPTPVDPERQREVMDRVVRGLTQEDAHQACIDRLWHDGYGVHGPEPEGWFWVKNGVRVHMTTAEAAIMAPR